MERDLSKLKIHMTIKERQERRRAKMKEAGGRELYVWLEPGTVRMVDELLDRYPRLNKKKLIAEAVRALYNSNFDTDS